MRQLAWYVVAGCVFFSAPALAQGETPPPGEPPKPSAEPAPPSTAAKPEAAPAPAPAASPPVVQMEDTAGASATVQPVAPAAAPAAAPTPGSEPPITAGALEETTRGGPVPKGDDWHFDFHGYLRAPMRVGMGHNDHPAAGQSSSTIHAPVIPDDQYLSWQHTKHNEKDWAELFLSFGNSWARGTVALQGFNFTDAAWTESNAQFGIAQGYVTLTPELPWENVRFAWKVGSFWNRYGTAGRYDAGEYDTYLFGRTHAMGETARVDIDVDDFTFGLEHGIGAKRPNPSVFNQARFTMLHHAHADATYNKWATLGVHYLHSWAQEEDRAGTTDVGLPDGSLGVAGADLRLDGNAYGYLYFGFSHISADHANTVAPAIEVLNSNGGGEFNLGVNKNYLDSGGCVAVVPGTPPDPNRRCSGGTGGVNTLLGQYEFSFANLMQNLKDPGSRFWGEGPDFKIALYGMYNKVASDDPIMNGVSKVKYGTDLVWSALSWFGIGLRADRVQPNNRIPEQSFAILSPRLIFRSKWVTHEEIQIQYSRYFYNQRTCANGNPANDGYEAGQDLCVQPPPSPVLPDGFGAAVANQDANTRGAPTTTPDLNVFKVQASMWW